jgi:hypothetical protein
MRFDFSTPYASTRLPLFARNIVSTSHPLAAQAGLRMMPGDEHFSQLRDDSVSAATKNACEAPAGDTQHGFANNRLAHL